MARAGARPVHYCIVEITVPQQGGGDVLLGKSLRSKPVDPPFVVFDSLRDLYQVKGTGLLQSGEAREGQTLRTRVGGKFPYPTEFTEAGKELSVETKIIGVEASLRGEVEKGGAAIAPG